jgi:hypothetical protein
MDAGLTDFLLCLCLQGIEFDLVFVGLELSIIPDDLNVLNQENCRNLDDKGLKSLNGCRVTDMILGLVPNIETFRTTLRAVKKWAQKRCVNENRFGYLGGVNCAILVAKICQLFPNAAPSTLLSKFFLVYHQVRSAHRATQLNTPTAQTKTNFLHLSAPAASPSPPTDAAGPRGRGPRRCCFARTRTTRAWHTRSGTRACTRTTPGT